MFRSKRQNVAAAIRILRPRRLGIRCHSLVLHGQVTSVPTPLLVTQGKNGKQQSTMRHLRCRPPTDARYCVARLGLRPPERSTRDKVFFLVRNHRQAQEPTFNGASGQDTAVVIHSVVYDPYLSMGNHRLVPPQPHGDFHCPVRLPRYKSH